MKTCPNCNLYFNDGYACPNCGGALYDQDPYGQQAAYGQDTMAYNPYAAAPEYNTGYDQQAYGGYAQQQPYGYGSVQQQQPYGAQSAPLYQSAPQMPATEPAYAEPVASLPTVTAAPAAAAAVTIAKPTHRVRNTLLIILALIVTAVASILIYATVSNMKGSEPTELETAVVNTAWTWQADVNGLLDEMEGTLNNLQSVAEAANAPADAAADANAAGNNAADAAAAADAATVAEATANAADAAAETVESLTEGDAAVPAEATADAAEAAVAAAEDAAALQADAASAAADAAATSANAAASTVDSLKQLLGFSIAIQAFATEGQLQAIDSPMQALNETYPDVVTAWNSLRDVLANYRDRLFNADEQEGTAPTANPVDATNAEAAPDAAATDNAEAAASADEAATENAADATPAPTNEETPANNEADDITQWQAFLEEFRAASSNFVQKANEAGFTLS